MPPRAPHRASLPVFARGYSNMLCIAEKSSSCHLKVLLGSRVNSLCPSSYFRHPMASAKQLYVDLNHMFLKVSIIKQEKGNREEVLVEGWGNTYLLFKLP